MFKLKFAPNLKTMETTVNTNIDLKGNWTIDPVHTDIGFTVNHLVISHVNGSFEKFDGTLTNASGNFEDSKISFKVETASVNTRNEMHDNHLKSDDFFNSETYPYLKLDNVSISETSKGKYILTGDLTIRDITKPVEFDVRWGGVAKDGYGNDKMGFRASTEIDRFDFGLKWNQLTEAGGFTVGKKVEITANLQFAKQ